MILRTFNLTFGLLVAFSVWCMAIMVVVIGLHLLTIGGLVMYHLTHS